jgi:hypothetical protein
MGRPPGNEVKSWPKTELTRNAVAIQHIKIENEGWERDL